MAESVFPESTKKFIVALNRAIQRKNVYDIQHLYESEFSYQTSKHYKTSLWPSPQLVSPLVDDDENFMVLYKQLYHRHMYVRKLSSGLSGHFSSFQNYMDLFNIILGLTTEAPEFEIPAAWCWDMIDEFVYQFYAFHSYRSRPDLTEADRKMLKDNPHAWSAQTVIRFLLFFASKGEVGAEAAEEKKSEAGSPHALFETLGVYALIGMLRINSLMGDYTGGIEVLEGVDITGAHEHVSVPAAHASLHYHMAFAYLVTRRYAESVRYSRDGLVYLARNKALIPRTYQQNNIYKMQEQMYGILALATSLVPQGLEEGLAAGVHERFASQMQRMRVMDMEAYSEVFKSVAPKFVPMSLTNDTNAKPDDGLAIQLKVFLKEVESIRRVPDIYSYLKLCTTINVERLTSFLGEESGGLTRRLLYLKHKTQSGSPALEKKGSGKSKSSDIQFVVSEGMVHVSERRQQKQHADFFIREILRYEYVVAEVEASRRVSYF
ncbi:hypothetical protein AAMO2058_001636000 [Amorphochlora amoebiformis]|mmetsp:Transcript_4741/g.7234  ORF Transcript_4741/g.7234 Transcript_4741/m.7234 type:complete len:491 (-) Transcript_4741:113-1585(-)